MKVTKCGHALSLSSRIHACGTAARPSRAACVACGCNPPRSLRSYHRSRSVRAEDQVVRGCRGSMGVHLALHEVAGLANLDQSVGECIVLEVQRRVAIVVARAFQRSLWDRPCLATSSSLQTHRWHYRPYTCCRGWLRHTLTSLIDSDRKLCILAS